MSYVSLVVLTLVGVVCSTLPGVFEDAAITRQQDYNSGRFSRDTTTMGAQKRNQEKDAEVKHIKTFDEFIEISKKTKEFKIEPFGNEESMTVVHAIDEPASKEHPNPLAALFDQKTMKASWDKLMQPPKTHDKKKSR